MNEKDTHKLIGKLSGAVVFLSVVVIGLVITILVLFAFQTPANDVNVDEDEYVMFCGTGLLNPNYGNPTFENGERLFNQNCASCHFVNKDMTGPALKGARERGWEYSYENWIYDFIRKEDSLVQIEDAYTLKLREDWDFTDNSWSHNFPLTHSEIDDLMNYAY